MNEIATYLDELMNLIPKIVAFCSMIAAFLPPTDTNSWAGKLHGIINSLAFNFNHAENKA